MSFNFSGDEDDDDELDLDAFDDTGLLALASRERTEGAAASASAASTSAAAAPTREEGDGGGGDDDVGEWSGDGESDGGDWGVDWEDADSGEDEDDENVGDENGNACAVMVHLGKSTGKSNDPDECAEEKKAESKDDDEGRPSKKRKRATVRVLRNVPLETQQMVLDVRRSELLCRAAQCTERSLACGAGGPVDEAGDRALLLPVAHSLIPPEFHAPDASSTEKPNDSLSCVPTKPQLRRFAQWFFQLVNRAGERRRSALRRNVAQGAAAARPRQSPRRSPGGRAASASMRQSAPGQPDASGRPSEAHAPPARLLQMLMHLSPRYGEDPQLFSEEWGVDAVDAVERITALEKALLLLAMVRSLGWRARYVTSLDPIPLVLTVDHLLLATSPSCKSTSSHASFGAGPPSKSFGGDEGRLQKLLGLMYEKGMFGNEGVGKRKRKRKKQKSERSTREEVDTVDLLSSDDEHKENGKKASAKDPSPHESVANGSCEHDLGNGLLSWVEVLCRIDDSNGKSMSPSKQVAKWVPTHPEQESFDEPEAVESILAWRESNDGSRPSNGSRAFCVGKRRATKSGKTRPPRRPNPRIANKYPRKSPVSYVLAVEHSPLKSGASGSDDRGTSSHRVRFTDVTPRYAGAWSRTLRLRGATGKDITSGGGKCVDEWWSASLKQMNAHFRPQRRPSRFKSESPVRSVTKTKTSAGREVDVVELASSDDNGKTPFPDDSDSDEHVDIESKELSGDMKNEKIPTSKAGFKQSPFYVIPSVLNAREVLHPEARKHICGVFKGELVYRRSDVSKALRAEKWLYHGRKVKQSELGKPSKQIKARKRPTTKGFKALSSYGITEDAQNDMIATMEKTKEGDNEMDDLYGRWQTDPWSPAYVGPTDAIPTNAYKNVELALINPGLTHMDQPRLASIAKKLMVPYAPCMLGYEGHGGNRAPTIRGIVVHDHNVALLREAYLEWESHIVEEEQKKRRNEILRRWKRLVVGILTKERLDREYG
ncbi:hypothetical protein ACHAWF_014450 [Thalassiosira exigua]